MTEIIEETIEGESEDEGDDTSTEEEGNQIMRNRIPVITTNKEGEVPTLIEQHQDISDEELMAEFEKSNKPEILHEE